MAAKNGLNVSLEIKFICLKKLRVNQKWALSPGKNNYTKIFKEKIRKNQTLINYGN